MSKSKTPHGNQSVPFEWGVATIDDTRLVVRDVPEGMVELYEIVRESRNPRAMLKADSVIYDGRIARPVYDDQYKSVELYHDYAGRLESIPVGELVDDPVFLLREEHVAKHVLDFADSNHSYE